MINQPSRIATFYAAFVHLDDVDAARHLGKTLQVVRAYRATHPQYAYRPAPEPVTRPGIISLRIPMYDPSRNVSGRAVLVMDVSLPAPPNGITFDRQGVSA